jgi:hypothetical protein
MGKRKSLAFEAKIKIIEELEKGVPQRDLSLKNGVSKLVISLIKKQRKFKQTDRRESRQRFFVSSGKQEIAICVRLAKSSTP